MKNFYLILVALALESILMIANCFFKTSKRTLALTTMILNIFILSGLAIISGICGDEMAAYSKDLPSMYYFVIVGLLTLAAIYINTAHKDK